MATTIRLFSILIPAGTIVQRDDSKMIRLACDVIVDARLNELAGGCYDYECAGHQWSVASGCVQVQARIDPTTEPVEVLRHKDGLVDFA